MIIIIIIVIIIIMIKIIIMIIITISSSLRQNASPLIPCSTSPLRLQSFFEST